MFTKKWKNVLVAVCALTLSVSSVLGGLTLKVNADDAQTVVVNPIAKYEFKDANNHGKDSMGNYDLEIKRAYVAGAEGPLMNEGTLLEGGGVSFAGNYCLGVKESNDPFATLNAFTLRFEIKGSATQTNSWPTYIGWSNGAKHLGLQHMAGGAAHYIGFNAVGTKCGEIWGNAWLQNAPGMVADGFNEVIISVQPGGTVALYVNGNSYSGGEASKPLPYEIPANYNVNDGAAKFAIGAAYNGAAVYPATGAIRGLEIYDFAMTSAEVGEYRANGAIVRPADLKVTEAVADLSDTLLFQEADSDETILAGVGTHFAVDAKLSDGSTRRVAAKVTGVEVVNGSKMIVGTIAGGVANPDGVKAYAKIGMIAEVKSLNPVAKYEFKDATNPGKDSMGNYDLEFRVTDEHTDGAIAIENGVATFDGSAGLQSSANNDLADKLDSYTMNFEINIPDVVPGSGQGWGSPISMTGFNDWNATQWNWFHFSGNSDLLRFSAVGDGSGNPYWGAEIGKLSHNEWHKVTMVVDTTNRVITVYLDGIAKYSKSIDDTYSTKNNSSRFAIGGASCWGNIYVYFQGGLKNVSVYDFAMTSEQVGVYNSTGELKTNSLLTESWIESIDTTLAFENGTALKGELFEDMTSAEKVSLLNAATVNATISNNKVQKSTKALPVMWTAVEEVEGKWFAKGFVQNTGLSMPSIAGRVEVSQEVPVTASYSIANGEIENGTLKAEKTWGVPGDVVTVVAKPAEHYELSKMYVNGVEIVPVDGVYSFTMSAEDAVLTADFVLHQYAITAGEMENGTVTFESEGTAVGTLITITPVPAKYYVATNVYVNGTEIAPDGSVYTFRVEGDAVVTATFAEAVYSVDAYVRGENGTVDIGGVTSSKGGVELVINVTPAEGYVVDYVEVNGEALEAVEGVYSIIIEGDTEIEVRFKEYVKPEPPVESSSADENTEKPTKSCKSVMGSTGLVALMLMAGAAFVAFRKKD